MIEAAYVDSLEQAVVCAKALAELLVLKLDASRPEECALMIIARGLEQRSKKLLFPQTPINPGI